jgi:hypothetical protein
MSSCRAQTQAMSDAIDIASTQVRVLDANEALASVAYRS